MTRKNPISPNPTRREFLRKSSAVAAATALPLKGVGFHNSVDDVLKVGLVGCGGRGTGAAANALRADAATRLVAMGDAFANRVESSLAGLQGSAGIAEQVDVPRERRFLGFDAYQRVIEESDVVLLATPPHFRPLHVEAAVSAGKHLFVEKPVAVDAPGIRRVMDACRAAADKGLSLVSGLCYRYQFAKQETIKRIHGGAIGDLVSLQCSYNTGGLWHHGRKPEWSDMEYQVRNWLYFNWLSGDHINEQHIHSLDKVLWAMGDETPSKVTASGGRISRIDDKYGDIYDHFNTVYQWDSGVKAFSSCRQIVGASSDVSDFAHGTEGTAEIQSHRIKGANAWRWRGDGPDDMYQNEHDALFKSIRAGAAVNNGDYMCKSTMMAIAARMSAYTGRSLSWDEAMKSQEDLTPVAYVWGDAPAIRIPRPGVTPFV
ncbi:MAG TPA: oxidoreductase [Planctomycetes bacterium]|nr:oxidoreductase [Planctomycetota bacterium]|tara:strand:- start:932 stop:2221 length:1290 start_codon:yes stop_codon:yes gene_type:complete